MNDYKVYHDEILKHFRNPCNKKTIENPDFSSSVKKTSCGDSILFEGKVEKNENGQFLIKDMGFNASGCIVSLAAASMLTQKCIGMNIENILSLSQDDIIEMVGLKLGPTRSSCAVNCIDALQEALINLKKD